MEEAEDARIMLRITKPTHPGKDVGEAVTGKLSIRGLID
jgi:hypothetical protein